MALQEEGEATDKVFDEVLEAKADANPEAPGNDGEGGEVKAKALEDNDEPEGGDAVGGNGCDRSSIPLINLELEQQILVQECPHPPRHQDDEGEGENERCDRTHRSTCLPKENGTGP